MKITKKIQIVALPWKSDWEHQSKSYWCVEILPRLTIFYENNYEAICVDFWFEWLWFVKEISIEFRH